MGPVDESALPPSHRAKQMFIEAMDNWDESAADTAIVGLVRKSGADELFEIFARYGARDFRDIGHKAIYVANSFRTLETIGWQHAEPVLRSLAYALLDRSGAKENPAKADLPADRPFRQNLPLLKSINDRWLDGKLNADATKDSVSNHRSGSTSDTGALALKLLNQGVAPQSHLRGALRRRGRAAHAGSRHSLAARDDIHERNSLHLASAHRTTNCASFCSCKTPPSSRSSVATDLTRASTSTRSNRSLPPLRATKP